MKHPARKRPREKYSPYFCNSRVKNLVTGDFRLIRKNDPYAVCRQGKAVALTNRPGKDDEKTPDRKPDTQSSIKVGKASIKSAKKKKASPTVTITLVRKVAKASGYQIKVYPTSGKAKKNKGAITTKFITKNTKKLVVKNKKLKNKKGCYVRIRAYQKINGTKKFGAWSAVRKVKNR